MALNLHWYYKYYLMKKLSYNKLIILKKLNSQEKKILYQNFLIYL